MEHRFIFLLAFSLWSMAADENALLRAIELNPGEDTPRLMYADWLDEHDQGARAEFIRLQIELVGLPRWSDKRRGLELRASTLLETNESKWLSDAPLFKQHGCRLRWQRGFPAELTVSDSVLVHEEVRRAVDRLATLSQIRFTMAPPDASNATRNAFYVRRLEILERVPSVILPPYSPVALGTILPHLSKTRHLEISVRENVAEFLEAFPDENSLTAITFRCYRQPDLGPFSRTAKFRNLESLSIYYAGNGTDPGVELAPLFRRDRVFTLKKLQVRDFAPANIDCASSAFRSLRALELDHFLALHELRDIAAVDHELVSLKLGDKADFSELAPALQAQLERNRARFADPTCFQVITLISQLG